MTTDPITAFCQTLPLPRRVTKRTGPHTTTSYVPGIEQTAEQDAPWVVYTYGTTSDDWWPFWRSSRVLGRAVVVAECAICGKERRIVARIPRFGDVGERPRHPERLRFLLDHVHRERGHPMSWARPLLNMNVHQGGLDLDMFAMRLEADLRDAES